MQYEKRQQPPNNYNFNVTVIYVLHRCADILPPCLMDRHFPENHLFRQAKFFYEETYLWQDSDRSLVSYALY